MYYIIMRRLRRTQNMKITYPTMSIQKAHAYYHDDGRYNEFAGFDKDTPLTPQNLARIENFSYYSPAYVLSNENLRWVTGLTRDSGRRVLTVAASGDQALFYSINGADKIDTFDVSFCSKAIMDIKTALLQTMSRDEYIALLIALHNTKDVQHVAYMSEILEQIPQDSAQFVRAMRGRKIFSNGLTPNDYKEFYPTAQEYKQMRDAVNNYFKFIWTDIGSLHTHLTAEYDVINLSNILEYMGTQQIHNTLASLRNHVRPGGYIIAQTGDWGINKKLPAYQAASEKFKKWAKIGLIKEKTQLANHEKIVVLQRTR